MDIFTLRTHMYNIIDGIVGIKFSVFCRWRVPILFIFRSISKYGIVWWGGVGEAEREDLKEMKFIAVLASGII